MLLDSDRYFACEASHARHGIVVVAIPASHDLHFPAQQFGDRLVIYLSRRAPMHAKFERTFDPV